VACTGLRIGQQRHGAGLSAKDKSGCSTLRKHNEN